MSASSRPDNTRQPSVALLEDDARWSLVLRIAGSQAFLKAAQLRDILLFLTRRALTEPGAVIREYDIGCGALGRKPDFNPHEDNIVRVQVGHLRKKLEEYFTTEGKEERLCVVIPKGAYVPRFDARLEGEVEQRPAPRNRPQPKRALLLKIAGAAALLAVGVLIGMGLSEDHRRQLTSAPSVDPIIREAWSPFAGANANVLLCTATPLNLQISPDAYRAYGTPTYPAPKEAYAWFRQHRPLTSGAKLGMFLTDNMLGMGILNAAVTTSSVLRDLGAGFETLPERVATFAALRGRNAILFGQPYDSDAITHALERAPLTVDFDSSLRETVIRDRQSGELLTEQKDADGQLVVIYGLITVLNTRETDRGRLGMIVFSGLGSSGVQGAAEFFASPRGLRRIHDVFARRGKQGFPAAYQVVVKCALSNLLVQSEEYVSDRILQEK